MSGDSAPAPRPVRAAREAYRHERAHGADEAEALDVAVHEALRLAGRPVTGTPRRSRADKRRATQGTPRHGG